MFLWAPSNSCDGFRAPTLYTGSNIEGTGVGLGNRAGREIRARDLLLRGLKLPKLEHEAYRPWIQFIIGNH